MYNEEEVQDAIDELRGQIQSGDCIYCGAKNTMVHENDICFACHVYKRSIHEDLYYRWAAGYDVDVGDDDDELYDALYGEDEEATDE